MVLDSDLQQMWLDKGIVCRYERMDGENVVRGGEMMSVVEQLGWRDSELEA